jgi:predicted RNA-binding Zn ribbon-like protein
MADLPSWYPGEEVKPAPMPLLVVQGFLNTLDTEADIDLLAELDAARGWLAAAGLLGAAAELSASDLELARRVRESLRTLLGARGRAGADAQALESLRTVADARCARLRVGDDGALGLESTPDSRDGVENALFELLLIVRGAQEDGTWSHLKVCGNAECRWAFYDRSRNQHGQWCDMAVCGNRLKNRQLRARRR